MEKKIQFAIVLVVLAAAIVVAVYLFTQSRKIEVMEGKDQPTALEERNKTEMTAGDKIREAQNASGREGAKPLAAAANATSGEVEAEPGRTGDRNASVEKPQRPAESVVTPRFIEDLVGFVIARYHPAESVDNPGPRGTTSIDFKSLNARYGLELIGLRHQSSNLRRAREEILTLVMDPQVIESLYDQYAELFVDELVARAGQTQKTFVSPKEQRQLQSEQVVEMLRLNADYIGSLAEVFQVLGENPNLPAMVESYLEAEKEAVHANFVLNQRQNELAMLRKEIEESEQAGERLQLRLEKVEDEKDSASSDYKQAIQNRERIRQKLVQTIRNQTGQIGLETHEILYVAEWVHRRISEGENNPAILVGADVLDDLVAKLRSRAEAIASDD